VFLIHSESDSLANKPLPCRDGNNFPFRRADLPSSSCRSSNVELFQETVPITIFRALPGSGNWRKESSVTLLRSLEIWHCAVLYPSSEKFPNMS